MKKALILMLRGYKKLVSPYLIKSCRYEPSCSEYATEAIEKFGIFKGTALALWRVLRCNPFSRGGFDPVPRQ
jgi:putative membrane protein insertion efficiency factor